METHDGFYKLGTRNGILPQLFSRNQIAPCASNFLKKEEVPGKTISLVGPIQRNRWLVVKDSRDAVVLRSVKQIGVFVKNKTYYVIRDAIILYHAAISRPNHVYVYL